MQRVKQNEKDYSAETWLRNYEISAEPFFFLFFSLSFFLEKHMRSVISKKRKKKKKKSSRCQGGRGGWKDFDAKGIND